MSCKPRVYSSAYRPVNAGVVNVESEYIIYCSVGVTCYAGVGGLLRHMSWCALYVVLGQRSEQVNGVVCSLIIPVTFLICCRTYNGGTESWYW